MLYIVITASLIPENFEERKQQYINGIMRIQLMAKRFPDAKLVIVENNGYRETFLKGLGIDVLYTNMNCLNLEKGVKELLDIKSCIQYYNMAPTDFLVKITGRYLLEADSPFFQELMHINNDDCPVDCIIKYGYFLDHSPTKIDDCITGLIGMRVKYILEIEFPQHDEVIEWKWAKASRLIDPKRIESLDMLGIRICPGGLGLDYFLV
jgi:hypothetical protein